MKAYGGMEIKLHIILNIGISIKLTGWIQARVALLPGKECVSPVG
jgi:hypothetical protein